MTNMKLEQIVKETVAKIVAEKTLTAAEEKKREEIVKAMKKDFKGPAPAMYAIATDKAKKLAEDGLNEDYEVAMAQDSLDAIIRSVMMLKAQMGDKEVNLPAWIQDHITNAENYIYQAAKGYHESDAQMDDKAGSEEMNEAFKIEFDDNGNPIKIPAILANGTPFEKGEKAQANRIHYTSNPYPKGSAEYDEFYNGWMNAETASQMAHDEFMFRKERGMDETRDPNSKSDTPYYAIFDFHSKQQFYIIAKSASEMLSRLNGYIKAKAETNPEYKFSYDMEDLQDDYYNGKLMPHVISDDFASVTKNAEEFKQDLSYYPNAIEYKGLQELDEWTIRRMQHYAGIK